MFLSKRNQSSFSKQSGIKRQYDHTTIRVKVRPSHLLNSELQKSILPIDLTFTSQKSMLEILAIIFNI